MGEVRNTKVIRCAGCNAILHIPVRDGVDLENRFFCKNCYNKKWGDSYHVK